MSSHLDKLKAALEKVEKVESAEYQGKKVTLNKPKRGGSKKFYVYVKNEKGNVVKVSFGDPNMEIKRDDPKRRKNFRARHNCSNPGPKWKARYWSCWQWRASTPVKGDDVVEAQESDPKEVKVGNYQTSYFFVCPSAAELYNDIEDKVSGEDLEIPESSAKLQDVLFYLEDMLVEKHKSATAEDKKMFRVLGEQIMDVSEMMGMRQEHSYIMDVHVKKIDEMKS